MLPGCSKKSGTCAHARNDNANMNIIPRNPPTHSPRAFCHSIMMPLCTRLHGRLTRAASVANQFKSRFACPRHDVYDLGTLLRIVVHNVE
eukprot:21710-Amphidinium_carterae.1